MKSHASPKSTTSQAPAAAAPAHADMGNAAAQEHLHAHHAAPRPETGSSAWETGGAIIGGLLGGSLGAEAGRFLGGAVEQSQSAPPDLGDVLAELAASSPALATALDTAKRSGWQFVYGAPGGGTSSDSASTPPVITIDPNDTTQADELAKSLAHELGHAVSGRRSYEFDDTMDRDRYVRVNTRIDLEGEAEATIMELRVRDDLIASDGKDIGITGATSAEKIAAWEEHKAGRLTREELVDRIADLFATREQPSTDSGTTYWTYYAAGHAEAWDRNNPPPSPLPIPEPS